MPTGASSPPRPVQSSTPQAKPLSVQHDACWTAPHSGQRTTTWPARSRFAHAVHEAPTNGLPASSACVASRTAVEAVGAGSTDCAWSCATAASRGPGVGGDGSAVGSGGATGLVSGARIAGLSGLAACVPAEKASSIGTGSDRGVSPRPSQPNTATKARKPPPSSRTARSVMTPIERPVIACKSKTIAPTHTE
jgi:hypothetical protein